ncbi:MAG: hypothetical protein ACR2GQ_04810 [Gemmatimonadota bacterium]
MHRLADAARDSIATLLLPTLLLACGGGTPAPEPIYVLGGGAGPLRYVMESENSTLITIPGGGEQKVESTSAATFTLEYGQPSPTGVPFTVVFESFELTGGGPVDPGAFLNQPIRGVVDSAGSVHVTEAPEFEAPVPGLSGEALGQMIGPLAVPLPPGGAPTEEAWPVTRTTRAGGGLEGESTFEGTASFVPGTEWEGRPARTIVAEGAVSQSASGTPPGAPGEVEVNSSGTARTTYAWDPARGVVLHVSQETAAEGDLAVVAQGMVFPVTSASSSTFTLTE